MNRNIFRKVVTFVVALMVVTTVAISGVGPAPEDASPVEEGGAVAPLVAGSAVFFTGVGVGAWLDGDGIPEEDVEEAVDAETTQQRIDMAQSVRSKHASSDQYLTTSQNTLDNSRNIVSQQVKAEIAEMLNNGTTDTSTISTKVNETIEDYYAVHEHNLLKAFSTHIQQVGYVYNRTQSDGSMGHVMKPNNHYEANNGAGSWNHGNSPLIDFYIKNESFEASHTLINGSTVDYTTVLWNFENTNDNSLHMHTYDSLEGMKVDSSNDYSDVRYRPSVPIQGLSISPSNDSLPDVDGVNSVYNASRYDHFQDDLESATSDMKANYGPSYITSVVAQYQTGELNTSELISPEILANEWATDYNRTGESIYKWANAVALGIDAPDLNETSKMELDYQRRPTTRMVRFNASLTGSSWSDSTPVNMTLTFDDQNNTQKKYTLYNGSGPQDPVVTIPAGDGPAFRDIDVTLSWDEGGELWNFSIGKTTTTANGELSLTQERVETVDVTEWGMLFSDDAPSNGWNVSETYNITTDFTDSVYFAMSTSATEDLVELEHVPSVYEDAVSTEARMLDLEMAGTANSQEFTITRIIGDDGSNLSSVGTRDYNQQTTSVSEFVNQTQRILEVQKTIEENEPELTASSGGFPDWIPGDSPLGNVVIFLLGGAVVVLALRP